MNFGLWLSEAVSSSPEASVHPHHPAGRAELFSTVDSGSAEIETLNLLNSLLEQIDRKAPKDLDLHLVLDNYATHKHPEVKAWLETKPRFTLHFVPTSCSWLNLVERFFAHITTRRIRRGSFESVSELQEAIKDYLRVHNRDPKPFNWTVST